jgi:hypothetical protein
MLSSRGCAYRLYALFLIFFLGSAILSQTAFAQQHAPDTAPAINRENGWCANGSITATTVRLILCCSYDFCLAE